MPRIKMAQEYELQTRSLHTKVNADMAVSVDGKELPSMEVLGKATEAAIAAFQEIVTESYKQVPDRPTSPVGV